MYYATLFVSLSVIVVCSAYPRGYADDERRSADEVALASVARRGFRGWLDCKQPQASCSGFPPCCDNHVCYFPNGMFRGNGVCVPCVDRSQVCQRDSQCCEPLICQKENGYDVNGICDVKKPLDAECHDNDQCESGFCNIDLYRDVVMGHGGKCATPGTGSKPSRGW